jgi:signal transduction histidine kinase
MSRSPRVAAVLEHARARRSRESRALRLLSLPLLLVVIVPALSGHPAPSAHGSGLAVSAALVALVASFAVVRARGAQLDSDDVALWPTVAALVLMAGAGVVLIAAQPSGSGALVLGLVAYVAGARLTLRSGLALLTCAAIATVAALAARDSRPTIAISSTVLLAALLFVMARLFRRAEADRERAELATAELENARERELESAAVAERARIARELHDVLAHSLSGLSLQLESARLLAERENAGDELQAVLGRSRMLVADGLEDARRAVRALRGEALPGLDELPELVESFRAGGLELDLRVVGAQREVRGETALAVYRAAQEALTNVARHSGAASAEVALEYAPGAVRLTVTDAGAGGRGGPPLLAGAGSGYGLGAMRERAELLGGQMSAGPVDRGFRVEIELPA